MCIQTMHARRAHGEAATTGALQAAVHARLPRLPGEGHDGESGDAIDEARRSTAKRRGDVGGNEVARGSGCGGVPRSRARSGVVGVLHAGDDRRPHGKEVAKVCLEDAVAGLGSEDHLTEPVAR